MYPMNVASLCFPSSPMCLVILLNLHNNFLRDNVRYQSINVAKVYLDLWQRKI